MLSVEFEIWAALLDVANGTAETLPRLQQALVCIEQILRDANLEEMSGWFAGAFIIVG